MMKSPIDLNSASVAHELNLNREDLLQIYYDRVLKNPLYSKRAFARDLGVSLGTVLNIFTNEKQIRRTTLKKLSERLKHSIKSSPLNAEGRALKDNTHSMRLKLDRSIAIQALNLLSSESVNIADKLRTNSILKIDIQLEIIPD